MMKHLKAIEETAVQHRVSETERRLVAVRARLNRVRGKCVMLTARHEALTQACEVDTGNVQLEEERARTARSLENFQAQISALRDVLEELRMKLEKKREGRQVL